MKSTYVEEEEKIRFLDDVETELERNDPPFPADTPYRSSLVLDTCFYLITMALVFGIIALAIKIQTLPSSFPPSNRNIETTSSEDNACGATANAARDHGCIFDPLTFAWLPPACYDYNLTAEFLRVQDWSWWRERPDGSRRQLSLINVMQSSDEVLYVNWEYHRQHCVFMWKKMQRAMLNGGGIDGLTMWEGITGVCDGVLRDTRAINDTSVPGYIRYPSCKVY